MVLFLKQAEIRGQNNPKPKIPLRSDPKNCPVWGINSHKTEDMPSEPQKWKEQIKEVENPRKGEEKWSWNWKQTGIAAILKHLFQDPETGRIVVNNQDAKTGRELIRNHICGFSSRNWSRRRHRHRHRSFHVAQIHSTRRKRAKNTKRLEVQKIDSQIYKTHQNLTFSEKIKE